jgi:hypothetical protein
MLRQIWNRYWIYNGSGRKGKLEGRRSGEERMASEDAKIY